MNTLALRLRGEHANGLISLSRDVNFGSGGSLPEDEAKVADVDDALDLEAVACSMR